MFIIVFMSVIWIIIVKDSLYALCNIEGKFKDSYIINHII